VERAARNGGAVLLSINRFERKKRLDVAIEALAWLVNNSQSELVDDRTDDASHDNVIGSIVFLIVDYTYRH
jgi:glycosyltransferase involved in cell wall biosynthesis